MDRKGEKTLRNQEGGYFPSRDPALDTLEREDVLGAAKSDGMTV